MTNPLVQNYSLAEESKIQDVEGPELFIVIS